MNTAIPNDDLPMRDLTIIGAGPAGLFASYYAGFRGLSVAVIDAQAEPGGQVSALYPTKTIHDVAGFSSVTGAELVSRLVDQAMAYEPRMILGRRVVNLVRDADEHGITLTLDDETTVRSRAVILATGVGGIKPRTIPGAEAWHGRGVTYLPEPATHKDQDVVVVGGGDTALDWALQLQPIARSVKIVHRRRMFRAHASSLTRAAALGIELLTDFEIEAFNGSDRLQSVTIRGASGAQRELPADTVVGALGVISTPSPFQEWGIATDDRWVPVDSAMMTNVTGVFAVGDLSVYRGKVSLIVTGFGEAATAVNNAAVLIDPSELLAPEHSTDQPTVSQSDAY